MWKALESIEPAKRAGFLARTALYVQSGGQNPASQPVFAEESYLRDAVLAKLLHVANPEAAIIAGIDDQTQHAVLDELDNEAERWEATIDADGAIGRLSEKAMLPTDIYRISYSPLFSHFLSVLAIDDRDFIDRTVKSPDLETNYGFHVRSDEPSHASLFGKWFFPDDDRKRFLLVVVGRRSKGEIEIAYSLRIFPTEIVIEDKATVAEILERFAGVFGETFSVSEWRGKFLAFKTIPNESFSRNSNGELDFALWLPQATEHYIFGALIGLMQHVVQVAFALIINVEAYQRSVKRHDF